MNTRHTIINCDSKDTTEYIQDKTIGLIITSPPYPMIEMWDSIFSSQNEKVRKSLIEGNYVDAFEGMHEVLDAVWEDIDRILIDGGIVCINVGDATRNCNGRFKLFSNHSRIISKFMSMGYDVLPDIHWHKPTNAPNKFMGSGMYPPNAYVTYEHEYILIFRKGPNRVFDKAEKQTRYNSAYFWEERNIWFSDLWEIKGAAQKLNAGAMRSRSAAFPFELAYRLVNMYSIKGDMVYDPFMGTGTVVKASMACERNSIGVDIDGELCKYALNDIKQNQNELNAYIQDRVERHVRFIEEQPLLKKEKFYQNIHHSFKVKTMQEKEIVIRQIKSIKLLGDVILCEYE